MQSLGAAWVERQDERSVVGNGMEGLHCCLHGAFGIHIGRPVNRGHHVVTVQTKCCAHAIGVEAVLETQQRVNHGVAHKVNGVRGCAFCAQVVNGVSAGGKQ